VPSALRPGDTVVVRPAGEILATLDAEGTLDGMPFMPEMLGFLGRRFTVGKRAQKVCDTIQYTGSRRLADTVLLEDLRCDGAAHGGCQAECRIYWKEAWLRRVRPDEGETEGSGRPEDLRRLGERLAPHVRRVEASGGAPSETWRCQATDLLRCTTRYRLWEPGQYLRELTCGNVGLLRFVRVMARAVWWESKRKLGLLPVVHLAGTRQEPAPDEELGLRPGDWVEVKGRDDLRGALTPHGRNRGLWFDWEMERYCGRRHQVRSRVLRFIDDRNGKMVVLKTDAVTLEGVTCTGNFSSRRWFCPRAVYPYWRESWLRRVAAPAEAAAPAAADEAQPLQLPAPAQSTRSASR
jgi:hypothetical protein